MTINQMEQILNYEKEMLALLAAKSRDKGQTANYRISRLRWMRPQRIMPRFPTRAGWIPSGREAISSAPRAKRPAGSSTGSAVSSAWISTRQSGYRVSMGTIPPR